MAISIKNIAVVSSIILSRHSAEAVFLMEMCSAFSKNGFKVYLFIPKFYTGIDELFGYYGVEYPFIINQVALPVFLTKGRLPGRGIVFSILASKILNRHLFNDQKEAL